MNGASMNDADRIRRLREQAESMLSAPPTVVGSDDTGLVEVQLDGAGRVTAVEVHREWARRLGPESIGRAVVSAAGDAVTRRATVFADQITNPAPAPARSPEPRFSPEPDPPRDNERRGAQLLDLMSTLDQALAEIDVLTDRLEALATREITGRSASGRVTVTITGQQLVAVEPDGRWLREDPTGRQVADEIESACRTAYAAAAQQTEAAEAESPHVAEVRALTRDPREFVRRLGLG